MGEDVWGSRSTCNGSRRCYLFNIVRILFYFLTFRYTLIIFFRYRRKTCVTEASDFPRRRENISSYMRQQGIRIVKYVLVCRHGCLYLAPCIVRLIYSLTLTRLIRWKAITYGKVAFKHLKRFAYVRRLRRLFTPLSRCHARFTDKVFAARHFSRKSADSAASLATFE